MKTFAMRFSDNYAPKEGMLFHHQNIIDKCGYVWYGKFGNKILRSLLDEMIKNNNKRFLLIKSGTVDRYWVYFEEYRQGENPEFDKVPEYYRNDCERVGCWFKVTKFEKAANDVMKKCFLTSTGDSLSVASKHSMNPYFKIEYKEDLVID